VKLGGLWCKRIGLGPFVEEIEKLRGFTVKTWAKL
jgi:hypothetical protein